MSISATLPSYYTSLFSTLPSTSSTSSTSNSSTISTLPTISSSLLLDYYDGTSPSSTTSSSSSAAKAASSSSSTAVTPPWNEAQPTQLAEDVAVLSTTNFINPNSAQLTAAQASGSTVAEDNQSLFTLYQAVNSLSQLASLAQTPTATSGQLAGYNTRFQTGLQQVESYINSTTFNNFTLQTQTPSASVTSSAAVPLQPIDYSGGTIVSDANLSTALPGVSASQSFDISVTKGGTTTDVPIDLSQVQGPLTLDNIVDYVNQQLSAGGFATRFSRAMTSGSINDTSTATYGIQIQQGAGETISLSSSQATPSLIVADSSGSATPTITNTTTSTNGAATVSTTPADQQGSIVELDNLSSTPQAVSNVAVDPSSGNTTAQQVVVDSNGDEYVLGNATGNFGNDLNQGSQGVYLSQYDSAGNLQWTQLLSGSGSASAYSLALNPTGGVVVAGSTTSNLTTSGISNGNTGSFVAAYDSSGNQTWLTQIPTLNSNQANAVTVDSQGNVYVGGQVTGEIGSGQTSSGGTNAYLATLNSSGTITSEQQYGPSGSDQVSAMAMTASGNLVVASVQNGQGILSEYTGGDITSTPAWQIDMGNLQNGAIGGIAVSGNQIYVSGTTSNAALTAGGQATVANANSNTGGPDAFVFNATDQGTSATANYVSYVGATGSNQGNGITVGPDGTVYLAGTTTGTFAGQTRSVAGVNNAFVASLGSSGTVNWTQQFGGTGGQSTGNSVAVNPTGASVLNALGLPGGTVNTAQSVYLSSATSLQTGDSFQIQIEGTGGSTGTITIGQDETLQSLANQINDVLLTKGKASVTYSNGGEALKIAVNPGVTANLIPGPSGFDALSRLGIQAGTLTEPAAAGSAPATTTTDGATAAKPVYGLDLNTSGLNLSTSASAGAANAELSNVADIIQNIYQQTNAPPSTASSTTASQSSGTAPAYLTSQIANYNLALQMLTSSSSSSSSSTSSALGLAEA
jgi:hypothetical protein